MLRICRQSTIGLSHTAVCLMLADARTNATATVHASTDSTGSTSTGTPIRLAFYPAPERDDEGDYAEEVPVRLAAIPLALKRTVKLSKASSEHPWGMVLRDTEGALCQEIIEVKASHTQCDTHM